MSRPDQLAPSATLDGASKELEALRLTVAEQTRHLDTLRARLDDMAKRQVELRELLLEAHGNLARRDDEIERLGAQMIEEIRRREEEIRRREDEMRRRDDEIRRREDDIQRKDGEIDHRGQVIEEVQAALEEAHRVIEAMEQTRVWRAGQRFWRARDRMRGIRR
jgi:DNA repair exonuclease SbcCD ATPase subunit